MKMKLKDCLTKTTYLFVEWEVIWQANDSPLSKELHGFILVFSLISNFVYLIERELSLTMKRRTVDFTKAALFFVFRRRYFVAPGMRTRKNLSCKIRLSLSLLILWASIKTISGLTCFMNVIKYS